MLEKVPKGPVVYICFVQCESAAEVGCGYDLDVRWWWDLNEALLWSDLLQCILFLYFTPMMFHLHLFYVLLTKFLTFGLYAILLFISTSTPLRVQGKQPRSSKWTVTIMGQQRHMNMPLLHEWCMMIIARKRKDKSFLDVCNVCLSMCFFLRLRGLWGSTGG